MLPNGEVNLDELRIMSLPALEAHFAEFAGFMEDAPKYKYCIRVGSKTLYSNDTMDLMHQFLAAVGRKPTALTVAKRLQRVAKRRTRI